LLLSRRHRWGVRAVQALALAVCLITLLPTIGFLCGAEKFYGIARFTGIDWPTAIALLLLGLGLLCARPAEGLMAQVTAGDPGGVSIRRLLPASVILALLLGWLRLAGERGGVFDAATGTGIMMLVFIILFSGLMYHAARAASRAAEALRRSEEKFAKAFRSSPIAVAVTRLSDGRVIEVNEAMLKLLHFTRDEVIGRTTLELGIWVDVNDREEYTQRLVRERSVRGLEYRLRTEEGVIVTIQLSAELVEFGGEPCMLATWVDMTERKHVEDTLRMSEERFRKVFEEGPIGMVLTSRDFGFFKANPAFCRMLGYTAEEMNSLTFLDVTHPEHRAADRENVEKLWQGEIPCYKTEKRYLAKSGEIRWGNLSCSLIQDREGRPLYALAIVEDITERKRAEEALRESEERLRLLGDNLPESAVYQYVHETDGSVRFLHVSAGIERLNGVRVEDVLRDAGTLHRQILPEYFHQLVEAEAHSARELSDFAMELPMRRPDGQVRWMQLRSRPRRLPGGRVVWDGVQTDVTARRKAEEALRELNATLELQVARRTAELQHRARQLQKLTLELSQVEERERRRIAVILHEDVQQQIAGAKFHLGLLKNWAPQDAGREVIERVEEMLKEAIEKSRRLSHDLSPAVLYMNDLGEVLRWLADRMRAQHGLSVAVDISGAATLQSEALTMFLFRAAQELLFNVVKHARVNEAALRVRRRGRRVYLGVADRGRGFDPQEFNETAGFGLLSIRERVELLGGRMKIKSSKGRGSTLCLVVPDSEKPEDRRPKAEEGLPSSGRALRVLLADDHEIVREGLVSLLKEMPDLEVVGEASNGHEAIDLACTLQPDVLIMDTSMPIISGEEATRRIKERLPEIRIVALSMYEDAETIERMHQAGADSYVLKTAPSEELLAAIRGGEKAVGSRATSSDTSMSGRTDGKET
jgi:PAS domain S-box-containing protein